MLQILLVYSSSLLCKTNIFGFINLKALDSKGILRMPKEVLRQPHNVLTLQVSLLLHDKWHPAYYASLFGHLLLNLQIFLLGLGNSSESLGFFIKVS